MVVPESLRNLYTRGLARCQKPRDVSHFDPLREERSFHAIVETLTPSPPKRHLPDNGRVDVTCLCRRHAAFCRGVSRHPSSPPNLSSSSALIDATGVQRIAYQPHLRRKDPIIHPTLQTPTRTIVLLAFRISTSVYNRRSKSGTWTTSSTTFPRAACSPAINNTTDRQCCSNSKKTRVSFLDEVPVCVQHRRADSFVHTDLSRDPMSISPKGGTWTSFGYRPLPRAVNVLIDPWLIGRIRTREIFAGVSTFLQLTDLRERCRCRDLCAQFLILCMAVKGMMNGSQAVIA